MLNSNPDKLLKAQELYAQSVLGQDAKLAPDYIKYFEKASQEKNLELLLNMGYDQSVYTHSNVLTDIAKSPKRMQAYLNDFYLNNSTITRNVNIGPLAQMKGAPQDLIKSSLTEWYAGATGGSFSGAGLNAGKGIGYTGFGEQADAITGFTQFNLAKNKPKNPMDLVTSIKNRTFSRALTKNEIAKAKKITEKIFSDIKSTSSPDDKIRQADILAKFEDTFAGTSDLIDNNNNPVAIHF